MMMPTLSTKLIQLFGSSNGCVELGPKKPPPSAKNCFGATIAATGPRAMTCGLALPSGSVPIAPASTVVAKALPFSVIGMPPTM